MHQRNNPTVLICYWLLLLQATPTLATVEDIARSFGSTKMTSLATGYRQPLFDAPVTATVITADEFGVLGTTTLSDILETVAGFHVSNIDGRATVTTVRGITSRVLLLIDNTPVAQGLVNALLSLDNVLLYGIERIEVVRGPGSAMYGADAFAGVINLITKTATDIAGTQIGGLVGSFNTYDVWALHGQKWAGFEVAFSLSARTTDATDESIRADAQTGFDALFGTTASLAPGHLNAQRDLLDLRVDVAKGPFGFRVEYFNQDRFHSGTGLALALDPNGTFDTTNVYTELRYQDAATDHLDLTATLLYVRVDQDADLTLLPSGAFGGAFPNGVIQKINANETRVRGEITGMYSGWMKHRLRFGLGGFTNDFDNESDRRNYTVSGGVILPTGPVAEGAGINDRPFVADTDRDVVFTYLQDEWAFVPDWRLTTGIRWDQYSDFGNAINPRIGLVWNLRHNLTTKMLYGRAFRPPSVTELQSNGLLIGLGNPKLEPTTVDMVEWAVNYRASALTTGLTFFWYREDDLIELVPQSQSPNGQAYDNRGEQEGWGLELEASRTFTPNIRLQGNYAFQNLIGNDRDDDANIRFAPQHQFFIALDWHFAPDWRAGMNLITILDRTRATSDTRRDPDDYTLANLTIGRKNIAHNADVSLSIRNLSDENARIPSASATTIPDDIPLPGRNLYGQIMYRF